MASVMKTMLSELQDDFWEWELVWEARSYNFGEEDDPLWLACITCSWYDLILARNVFEKKPT